MTVGWNTQAMMVSTQYLTLHLSSARVRFTTWMLILDMLEMIHCYTREASNLKVVTEANVIEHLP